MPKTMEKRDVKLRLANAQNSSWPTILPQVRAISGKALPHYLEARWKETVATRAGQALEIKVGLIGADLYFRVKKGNSHVYDVKLVSNWQAPVDAEPDQEKAELIRETVRAREEAAEQARTSLAEMERLAKAVEDRLEAIEGLRGEVERLGRTGDHGKTQTRKERAGALHAEMVGRVEDAQELWDTWFKVYDFHRVDANWRPKALSSSDVPDHSRNFYFREMGQPNDAMKDLLAEMREQVAAAEAVIDEFDDFLKDSQEHLAAFRKEAAHLASACARELDAVAEGVKQFPEPGEVNRQVGARLTSIQEGGDAELALANADTATMLYGMAAGMVQRKAAHLRRAQGYSVKRRDIPNQHHRDPQIRVHLQAMDVGVRNGERAMTAWENDLKEARKTLKRIADAVS